MDIIFDTPDRKVTFKEIRDTVEILKKIKKEKELTYCALEVEVLLNKIEELVNYIKDGVL